MLEDENMYHFIIEFRHNCFLGHGTRVGLEQLQQMVQSHLRDTQIIYIIICHIHTAGICSIQCGADSHS